MIPRNPLAQQIQTLKEEKLPPKFKESPGTYVKITWPNREADFILGEGDTEKRKANRLVVNISGVETEFNVKDALSIERQRIVRHVPDVYVPVAKRKKAKQTSTIDPY